jgi:hypothetical protein
MGESPSLSESGFHSPLDSLVNIESAYQEDDKAEDSLEEIDFEEDEDAGDSDYLLDDDDDSSPGVGNTENDDSGSVSHQKDGNEGEEQQESKEDQEESNELFGDAKDLEKESKEILDDGMEYFKSVTATEPPTEATPGSAERGRKRLDQESRKVRDQQSRGAVDGSKVTMLTYTDEPTRNVQSVITDGALDAVLGFTNPFTNPLTEACNGPADLETLSADSHNTTQYTTGLAETVLETQSATKTPMEASQDPADPDTQPAHDPTNETSIPVDPLTEAYNGSDDLEMLSADFPTTTEDTTDLAEAVLETQSVTEPPREGSRDPALLVMQPAHDPTNETSIRVEPVRYNISKSAYRLFANFQISLLAFTLHPPFSQ